VASTAPAYSLAAALGTMAAALGGKAIAALLVSIVPMLCIAPAGPQPAMQQVRSTVVTGVALASGVVISEPPAACVDPRGISTSVEQSIAAGLDFNAR
jgi:hypothetical protein